MKIAQLCPTICDATDSTVHGILQARILKGVAYPFSRVSSQPRNWTSLSCIEVRLFTNWDITEARTCKKSIARTCKKSQKFLKIVILPHSVSLSGPSPSLLIQCTFGCLHFSIWLFGIRALCSLYFTLWVLIFWIHFQNMWPHELQHSCIPVLHHPPGFPQTHVHWVSDAIQSFHLLLPRSPLALDLSQHQGLFQSVSSLHQVTKVLEL